MDEIEINVNVLEMNKEEQTKWAYEQNELGKSQKELAEILGIPESTLKSRIRTYKKNNGIVSTIENVRKPNKNINVHSSTQKKSNVNTGELKNTDLKEDEIKVLKEIVEERKSDLKLFHEFRVYKELSKVPTNEETVRSAFNMSKTTTERLRKYANERRLPLQDLVELAVINLLDQYDKEN